MQGAIGWSAKESRIVQTSQGQREKPTWSGKVNPKPKPMAAITEEPGMFLFQPRTAPPQAPLMADPAASNDNSPRCPIPVKKSKNTIEATQRDAMAAPRPNPIAPRRANPPAPGPQRANRPAPPLFRLFIANLTYGFVVFLATGCAGGGCAASGPSPDSSRLGRAPLGSEACHIVGSFAAVVMPLFRLCGRRQAGIHTP